MASQESINEIKGSIGKLTYYKERTIGFLLKRKSEVTAQRMKTDPVFQRTRENGTEFGLAGTAGKTLRKSIHTLLLHVRDMKRVARLVKLIMHIALTTDTTSVRGQRQLANGDSTLLNGFNFNSLALLEEVFYAPFSVIIDRVAGTITTNIASFVPIDKLLAPLGATHFKVLMSGSEIDFAGHTFNTDNQETAILPWDGTATALINSVATVTAGTTLPLFAYLGVQFYEMVNGNYYPLSSGKYNALGIVKVDQV